MHENMAISIDLLSLHALNNWLFKSSVFIRLDCILSHWSSNLLQLLDLVILYIPRTSLHTIALIFLQCLNQETIMNLVIVYAKVSYTTQELNTILDWLTHLHRSRFTFLGRKQSSCSVWESLDAMRNGIDWAEKTVFHACPLSAISCKLRQCLVIPWMTLTAMLKYHDWKQSNYRITMSVA